MSMYRLSAVVAGIICLLLVTVVVYGLYTDCPHTAGYVFCEK